MAALSLKGIAGPRAAAFPALQALCSAFGDTVLITDASGKVLLPSTKSEPGAIDIPVMVQEDVLGHVIAPAEAATAVAAMLTHLAAREAEGRALAGEVLHLYREVHLIEQLSEQLAALLNVSAVSQHALEQAQRLITATDGGILVFAEGNETMQHTAAFNIEGPTALGPLSAQSGFVASVLERGTAEIVNQCARDQRALEDESRLHALICAPLRAGQRTVGIISLADSRPGATYSAADLKLLNTIALQIGAAIANAILCAEMVEAAQARTAFAAEMQAVSTVQQLLLQSASGETPGFQVDSVYLPASEVGGDFFLVSPACDGSLRAIVGDVSGKGLTAAMRVATILGALRRESSSDPSTILAGLNEALIAQGELGFTTACCVRLQRSGEFSVANAGHIAPYLNGVEVLTPDSLPLGLVPDQVYPVVTGMLAPGDRMLLVSDGVPEARDDQGILYGFDRLAELAHMPVQEIAEAARRHGQEDDITAVTITFSDHAA